MANRCDKIAQAELDKFISYIGIINQYNAYPLPEDVENRKEEFAERLETRMKDQKMTRAKLSEESGTSPTTIAKLINKTCSRVSKVHIYLFAAILNCSPHYLVGLVETPGGVCSPDGTQKGFVPFTFWSESEKALVESFKRVARIDKVFADYMYQIVNGDAYKIQKAKEILEQQHIVEKKDADSVECVRYLIS